MHDKLQAELKQKPSNASDSPDAKAQLRSSLLPELCCAEQTPDVAETPLQNGLRPSTHSVSTLAEPPISKQQDTLEAEKCAEEEGKMLTCRALKCTNLRVLWSCQLLCADQPT